MKSCASHTQMHDRSETPEYNKLLQYTEKLVEVTERSKGFVYSRTRYAKHILFDPSEMKPYFDKIRESLANGQAGEYLKTKCRDKFVQPNSSDEEIWKVLMLTLDFNGTDFEHLYRILPDDQTETEGKENWPYSFEESIVLGHTLVVVPVMQQYGPLTPKLDLSSATRRFAQPQPLLAVGMIGDCVKGKFWDELTQKADGGDEAAKHQKATLLNPQRLQQKMRALGRGLLSAREEFGKLGLILGSVLVGSGAFGGSAKVLAQPFVDSLNDLPFDNSKDEVNFFMFPPPKPEELALDHLKYKVNMNLKKGLGALELDAEKVCIVVAGFDPISLAPHGVRNRAFSAEGQLCHSTDLLARMMNISGKFVSVRVPRGLAWESPAAFFAKPQELKFKYEEAYDTVRFVPDSVLHSLGATKGNEEDVHLMATERVPPRVWNGDCFNGWILSLSAKTWCELAENW